MKNVVTLSAIVLTVISASGQQAELLKDINPGSASSYISNMTQIGNKVVFSATNSGNFNEEPWVTDGTAEGTFMLKEIDPSTSSGSDIGPMAAFNDEVYFSADDGTHGRELWKTDGTAEGTVMVKDIAPGSDASHPIHLTVFKGALYFGAYHPDTGYELWKTMGTAETTELVANLSEGAASTQPGYLYPTTTYLYFNSLISLKLYYSDGTSAGSGMASDQVKVGQLDDAYFTEYNNEVYFKGVDVTGPDAKGSQLWKVNGSSAYRVTEIVGEHEDLDPRYLTVASGKLLFAGIDDTNGRELWAYDGTSAYLLKNTNPSGHGYMASNFFIAFKNKLIFTGGDPTTGLEPWVSDGTESGTKMIKDLNPGTMNSRPTSPVIIDDTLYFSADDGTTAEIWKLTSPDGQPEKFTDITGGGAYGDQIRKINKTFVFNASDPAHGDELWRMTRSGSTAIDDLTDEMASRLRIFPNPVDETSLIEIPDEVPLPAEMTVYNATGSIIFVVEVSGRLVSLNELRKTFDPGLYVIIVRSGQISIAAKFIVSP